jgi:hypothetical protein
MVHVGTEGARPPRTTDFLRSATWAGTEPAGRIDVPGLRSSFEYGNGTYSVNTDGMLQTDVIYGEIRPQTVIVLHVRQWITNEIEDVNGALGRDFDLTSGGGADVFARGTVIHGRWASPGDNLSLQLLDAAGNPIAIPTGLAWVVLAE